MVTQSLGLSALAMGVGVYLLLSAVGLLANRGAAEAIVRALAGDHAFSHALGAIAFFVGGAIVLQKPGFDTLAGALLTGTAAWWMVEGAVMLTAPQVALGRADAAMHFRRMNLIALPVGLALIVGGALGL